MKNNKTILSRDRFYADISLEKNNLILEDKKLFHQLKNVLRKKVGDKIILFNGDLKERVFQIKEFFKNGVKLEILKEEKIEREPKIDVFLYCSLLKRDNFELLTQKATEIGVKEIVPLICQNTVKFDIKKERLEKIVQEAAEQSGRLILPKIYSPLGFKEAVEKATQNSMVNILFDIKGENFRKSNKESFQSVSIFIGPEGGWDKKEIEMAQLNNFKILNLGNFNLRAETAGIVSSFLVINFF